MSFRLFGMWGHAVDQIRRDGGRRTVRRRLVHVSFWLHKVPRPLLRCLLLGHKPVVDGVPPSRYNPEDLGHRWVCCGRCGRRGHLQGDLDPGVYAIGDRYLGGWAAPFPPEDSPEYHKAWLAAKDAGARDAARGHTLPGPIPRGGTGVVGGELVIGGGYGGLGFELKVGNRGSEHVLAARFGLGWLGTLYLHTSDGMGQAVQRWLNPTGYESRIIRLDVGLDEVRWDWWTLRDNDNGVRYGWWRQGNLHACPLDRLFGPKRYVYDDIPGCVKVGRVVDLPEASYLVALTLSRRTFGRRRGPKRHAWAVDWTTLGLPIPTKGPERGQVYGSGVEVSAAAVRAGTWPAEAAARIALQVVEWRTSEGWDPVNIIKADLEEVRP